MCIENTYSPEFTDSIKLGEFLNILDHHMGLFEKGGSDEYIKKIEQDAIKELETYYIIMYNKDKNHGEWIMTPLRKESESYERPFMDRVKILLKTGSWLHKNERNNILHNDMGIEIPFSFSLKQDAQQRLLSDELNSLYVSMVGLYFTLKTKFKDDIDAATGIFKKEDAIINQNVLKGWIISETTFENASHKIEYTNLYKQLSQSRYTT